MNNEKRKEQKRAASRRYRERHPDKVSAANKKWRDANVEHLNAYYESRKEKKQAYDRNYAKRNSAKKVEAARRWRIENPEKYNRRCREHYAKNIEYHRVYNRTWRDRNKVKIMLKAAKERARTKGIEYSLLIEDIIIPDICPVLGVPLKFNTRHSPSIDRIDITKGYTKDNIQIISKKANLMKNDASFDELISFANWVMARFYG